MTLHFRYLTILFTLTIWGNMLNAAPPTGENLWHLTAAIGTAVDELDLKQTACCVGTFTVLADIRGQEDIIESSIQDLADAQATCCASTFTVLADIRDNLSGGGSGCVPTALTISPDGTTLTAGVYCLSNDPMLTGLSTITISESNVVLDLSGHTITGSNSFGVAGITINSGLSNITIANGTISSCYDGINMTTTSGNRNITFKDLLIVTSSHYSINVSTTSFANNLLIKNVSMNSAGQRHISLSGNVGCIVDSCIMQGATTQATITSSLPVTFLNCIGTGGSIGFQSSDATNVIFDNCKALSNSSNGFEVMVTTAITSADITFNNCVSQDSSGGSGFDLSVRGQPLSTSFNNCQALNNFSNGFSITCDATAGGTANSILQNCVAQKNRSTGFNISTGIGITNTTFNNCQALINSSVGFSITCNLGSADCVIQDCIAEKNSSFGFTINATTSTIKTTLNNCIAQTNSSDGFAMTGDTNATLNTALTNCTAMSSSGSGNGFSFLGSSVTHNCQLQNCTSAYNNNIGFNLGNGISSGTNTINSVLKGCTAENNNSSGFDLEGSGTTHKGELQDCISNNNGGLGFTFTTSTFHYLVNNCSACNNIGAGFSFAGINTSSSCCNIQNCVASCNNGAGFTGAGNANAATAFYLNQASNNGTNYSPASLGSQSALVKAFTDPINGRGDNLAS